MFVHSDLDLSKNAWVEVARAGGHGVWLSGIDLGVASKDVFASYLSERMVPACALHWESLPAFGVNEQPVPSGRCVLFFAHSTLADMATKLLEGTQFMGKALIIHDMGSPGTIAPGEPGIIAESNGTARSAGADATASAIFTPQQVTVPAHTGTAPVDHSSSAGSFSVGPAVAGTRPARFWDEGYIQVVPMPKDGKYSFGPGGPGPARTVPLGKIPDGYVEYKHPPRPYRKNEAGIEYDPRWSARIQDNSSDEPWKSEAGFFYPTYIKLNEVGLIRDDWEPGQFVRLSEQEKGVCISNSPEYIPPGEMTDFRTLTFYGHCPTHVRPAGVGLGWGDWDAWSDWQLYGRLVKPEMLKKPPTPDPDDGSIRLVSETGEETIIEGCHGRRPGPQTIYERIVEKSNLGKGKRARHPRRQ